MIRALFFFLLCISFNIHGQTFLGNSKAEILAAAFESYGSGKISVEKFDKTSSFITVKNGYETLYYYLMNDVCVEFVVEKPYSCNCLDVDIAAYDKNCIATEENVWVSKDYSKKYQMVLNESNYSVSVVSLTSIPELQDLPKVLTAKRTKE